MEQYHEEDEDMHLENHNTNNQQQNFYGSYFSSEPDNNNNQQQSSSSSVQGTIPVPSKGQEYQKQPGKVYVSNLSRTTDEQSLEETFSQFGSIKQVTNKGMYAFVEFNSLYDAEQAIRSLNGYNLDGRQIRTQLAYSKSNPSGQSNGGSGGNANNYGGYSGGGGSNSYQQNGYQQQNQYQQSNQNQYQQNNYNQYKQQYQNTNYNAYNQSAPPAVQTQNPNIVSNINMTTASGGPPSRNKDSCFKCGGIGHWSSECNQPKKTGGYSGGGNAGAKCYNCGGIGHYARNCEKAPRFGNGTQQSSSGGYGNGGGGYNNQYQKQQQQYQSQTQYKKPSNPNPYYQ